MKIFDQRESPRSQFALIATGVYAAFRRKRTLWISFSVGPSPQIKFLQTLHFRPRLRCLHRRRACGLVARRLLRPQTDSHHRYQHHEPQHHSNFAHEQIPPREFTSQQVSTVQQCFPRDLESTQTSRWESESAAPASSLRALWPCRYSPARRPLRRKKSCTETV